MSFESLDLFDSILAWHRQHGPATIPCQKLDYPEDVINTFKQAYDWKSVDLPVRFVDAGQDIPDNDQYIRISANSLALVSGCLAGFGTDDLVKIARGHGMWVKDLIETFASSEQIHRVHPTSEMTGDEVFRRCFAAFAVISPEDILDVYTKLRYEDHYYMLAITTPNVPKVWPKTLINEYVKAHEGKEVLEEDEISCENHSFIRGLLNDQQLPWDESGPRYDWLLDRSGMLLPHVFKKSIASFTLWEDLVHQASENPGSTLDRVMDYCIGNPPLSLRPGIYNGLRSMVWLASSNIDDGSKLFSFLEEKLSGTWLESVLTSKILKLHLLSSDSQSGELLRDNKLSQSIFQEIMAITPGEMGFAQFHAISGKEHGLPPQSFDEDFAREAFICHLLTGLQCFMADVRLSEDSMCMVNTATLHCKEVIGLLAAVHEFDYAQFKELNSAGLRVLVDAGLDMRRLPRMNARDRGRLLEDELGM
jgi:hypothetical protein